MTRVSGVRSLGVDVSVRRGLDLVLLDGSSKPKLQKRRVIPDQLTEFIAEIKPNIVAIDSPPAWGTSGGSRRAEQELRNLAIHSYGTPSNPRMQEHTFFAWMKAGIAAFKAAEAAGFPRYKNGRIAGTAIEVFPHATAVVLAGCLPPASTPKKAWRVSVLKTQGVETGLLRSPDQIDAALAALTGLYALQDKFTPVGDPDEGVIVLPARPLPSLPYRRRAGAPVRDAQLHLPRLSPCQCGDPECRETTSGEFAPGHDARRKAALWKAARQGEEAIEELKRRGWQLPPGMR